MNTKKPNRLPINWDPVHAANQVMEGLTNVSAPSVRGAHDADFVIARNKAFIVYEANDVQSGENAGWSFIYAVMSIVDVGSNVVENNICFGASEMAYDNEKLPVGACFVPRIIQKDDNTLRCFFASEDPGVRESQTWYIDFDMERMTFDRNIYRAKLKTPQGIFDMQPKYFYQHAVAYGFTREQRDFGMYATDSFKRFGNQTYAVLNNFPIGQNALTVLNDEMDTFEILGAYNEPPDMKLTESAINCLPDGTWLAISRREDGDRNYAFSQSKDRKHWTPHTFRQPVANGTSSKPTFDHFNGIYYLGWQEASRINGVSRSVFNIEVSVDGEQWERKYRFESEKSFQYPAFKQCEGDIYLAVTQGNSSDSRKEYIMFGKLE